ncbi:MAG: DUF2934 domain-containing protein [Acidobacteriia bacterium]|nr:DUF2934 domain-containing protein [Terriglobia bacterium]
MKTKVEEMDQTAPEDYNQEIAEVAYSYWESRGRDDGHDIEDWLMAEQEVVRRHRLPSAERRPMHANAA